MEKYVIFKLNFKFNFVIKIQKMFVTRFEKVRILGQRAHQLSLGARPLVDINGITDALEIAEKEWVERKIPIIIKRTLPNGDIKEYSLTDMKY